MKTTSCPRCGHKVPESRRCIYCGAPPAGRTGETGIEERTVVENGPTVLEDPGKTGLPLHKMIAALGKMKAALGSGELEQGFYRHVAKGMIFDYLETLPRGEKVRFVARDLEGSDLAPYADDGMKKELMAYALAEADRQGGEKGEET
jgi:uncharacterized OB-fold protein